MRVTILIPLLCINHIVWQEGSESGYAGDLCEVRPAAVQKDREAHIRRSALHMGGGQNTVNAARVLMPEDANNRHIVAKMCTIFVRSVDTFLASFISFYKTLYTLYS